MFQSAYHGCCQLLGFFLAVVFDPLVISAWVSALFAGLTQIKQRLVILLVRVLQLLSSFFSV